MELIKTDTYRLSSGREFYAHLGIIGVSPGAVSADADSLVFYDGYDGAVIVRDSPWMNNKTRDWTQSEKRELADFMIALWNQWAALP